MKPRLFLWLVAAILVVGLVTSPVFAQDTAPKAQKGGKKAATAKTATPAAEKPAPAKAKKAETPPQTPPQPGMVWANTASKVYHKEGSRYYGKTKNGKWMTEDEAMKAGYKEAGAGAAKKSATAKKEPGEKKAPPAKK